jgi:3-oxoacyl-[acyl-carrier protein] reductase
MAPRLDGKVAIVTGAAHGIGKAYARRLAEDGAAVVIADLDAAGSDAVAAELAHDGFAALAARTDIADAAATEALAAAAFERFGRIDCLVNNAAMFSVVPMSRTTFDAIGEPEWDTMMAVNLRGTWLMCKAVVPYMRRTGWGKIVNISSSTVFEGLPLRIHYVTSKAGLIGFTRTLAAELGRDNITVNCVSPGSTLSEEAPTDEILGFRTMAASQRVITRVQTPADLVGAVSFFCSADSDFITGQTLLVDGGAAFN